MTKLEIHQFICRDDNYGVLLHDAATGTTISIDAPSAAAVQVELNRMGWTLTHILTTHHHGDHVEGNLALKQAFNCRIIGPEAEKDRIPGIDQTVTKQDVLEIAGRRISIFECPGHTLGHVAFHIAAEKLLFAADTLFAMGCGRVFEGTLTQMYHAVNQFSALPPDTVVYCGHEYTESNARFALAMEPGNRALQVRAADVKAKRTLGQMTCPTSIGEELATNPYMRCHSADIRKILAMEGATDAEVFAELRTRKNNFS
jgi:hydroxyacylglutathione hydrolase